MRRADERQKGHQGKADSRQGQRRLAQGQFGIFFTVIEPQAQGDDADVLDGAVGQHPLEVPLAEGEGEAEHISLKEILISKFPIFVLGFFGMTALSSLGMLGAEGSETLHFLRDCMQWIFGIGLVGQGAYIDFREIKAAGGKPLRLGLTAGMAKYVLALVVILLFMPKTGAF